MISSAALGPNFSSANYTTGEYVNDSKCHANLTGYWAHKHITGIFCADRKKRTARTLGRIRSESDHVESLENPILKEGIEDVEAKCKVSRSAG